MRLYGRGENGLNNDQKTLLLDFALWKIKQLLARPFRYRTQCFLGCAGVRIQTESEIIDEAPRKSQPKQGDQLDKINTQTTVDSDGSDATLKTGLLLKELPALLADVDIKRSIGACKFTRKDPTRVYYPAGQLYKVGKDENESRDNDDEPDADDNE